MLTMMDFMTNAACPQRSSWNMSEVGYIWARNVFGTQNKKPARKRQKSLRPYNREEAFRFELFKGMEKTVVSNCTVALCFQDDREKLSA